MKNKKLLLPAIILVSAILIIAVFCLLCVGSYLIFEPGRDVTYHQVNLTNSCSAKVPVTDQVSEYTDNLDIHYYSDYDYGPLNVKTKKPNELGIYDMSGNVAEWCLDWYGTYSSSAQTDPTGPASNSNYQKVYRGGYWYQTNQTMTTRDCQHYSSVKYAYYNYDYYYGICGLRLVMEP